MSSLALALVVGVVASVAATALVFAAKRAHRHVRNRKLHHFWRGFDGDVAIMATEYAVNEETISFASDGEVARSATSGFFVSFGMALAMSHLVTLFKTNLGCKPRVMGDKGHIVPREERSLVVLGSPANNSYLQRTFREFARALPLLDGFEWEVTASGVGLVLPGGKKLVPDIDSEESGTDYALIVRCGIDKATSERTVMISGCNMWATEAAARFLADPTRVKSLPREARNGDRSVAFVLRASVAKGHAERVELYEPEIGRPAVWLE